MSLNPLNHDLDGCVAVRIHAEREVKGCFVGMAHGWAVSLPDSDKLDRVFLVGEEVGEDLEESIGPELDDPRFSRIDSPAELAEAQLLWSRARSAQITVELQEAYAANRMERAA